MSEYHKIQTVFKRDPATKHKTLLHGDFSLPEFEYLAGNEWVYTEKVDGTNVRIYSSPGAIRYGGRTDRAQMPVDLIDALDSLRDQIMDAHTETFGDAEVVLYGEGYGPKIQKGGGNYRDAPGFVLFDVRVGDWWLQRDDVEDVAENIGLGVVPVIGRGTLYEMVDMAREGITSSWGDFLAEGIVARPATELSSRSGRRIIAKIKCKDFAHE